MAEKHFYEQVKYTKDFLLPYLQKRIPEFHKKTVFEVGCAEGGLLSVLHEIGMKVTGLELSDERANIAKEKNPSLKVIVGDITDPSLPEIVGEKYDVIIMREVIEHIQNKYAAFSNLEALLVDDGYLFMSFPPKHSPFAGHQQIGKSFLKAIPYLHRLPKQLLNAAAIILKEEPGYVAEIKHHYKTGCSIKEFELHCAIKNFKPVKKDFYLFRPIYAQRFGLPTIKLPNIPVAREVVSFGCETLLQKKAFIIDSH